MSIFLYTIIIILGASIIAKIIWVSTGNFPKRKKKDETIDIFINFGLVVWAINLLIIS